MDYNTQIAVFSAEVDDANPVGGVIGGAFVFATGDGVLATPIERMRITSSGNIGIGTSTPGQLLSVGGDILGNEIIGSFFTGTSTTATSTLPQLDVDGIQAADFIQISADVITDFAGTGLTVIATTGILEVDVSQTQITAVGTITTGTWQGTTIAVDQGGTGVTSLDDILGTSNEVDVANGANTIIGGDATLSISATLDLGGNTSIEIVNAANPTVDTAGEIALDTTDEQFLIADSGGTAKVIQTEVRIWGVTVASTSPAFDSLGLLEVPTQLDGYTMTRVQCHVVGGTSKIIAVEDASANSTEDITCATTNTTDDGSITNASVTASELMRIDFGAVSGTVNTVTISVFGTWLRE